MTSQPQDAAEIFDAALLKSSRIVNDGEPQDAIAEIRKRHEAAAAQLPTVNLNIEDVRALLNDRATLLGEVLRLTEALRTAEQQIAKLKAPASTKIPCWRCYATGAIADADGRMDRCPVCYGKKVTQDLRNALIVFFDRQIYGNWDKSCLADNLISAFPRFNAEARAAALEAQIAEQRGLDTPERVRFYEHDFYVLSNFSAFRVNWCGADFDTSEHAYHWSRFLLYAPHVAHCKEAIRKARSAHEAFRFAQDNKHLQRQDWDAVKVDTMREILRAKAEQHEYVRRKLLQTGDRELVEDSWRDDFWGWGPNRDGKNMLGKLWMEVRAEIRGNHQGGA